MYGFALCLASTAIATLYHYVLGWHAPYPLLSLPVLLGTVGGLGLVAGPVGLLVLRRRQHRLLTDPAQQSMDLGFSALLLACGISGLALLALRETAALPLPLATARAALTTAARASGASLSRLRRRAWASPMMVRTPSSCWMMASSAGS